jgi:ribosome-associated protein
VPSADPDADVVTPRGLKLPSAAIDWEFSRSGGPGGQHANVTASRVVAVADLTQLTGPGSQRAQGVLGVTLRVTAEDTRSQWRNRALARQRLIDRLEEAARPVAPRRKTKPSRGAVQRRLDDKKRQSQRKTERRLPTDD